MDRRKMLNMLGLGGLTTFSGASIAHGASPGDEGVMHYISALKLLEEEHPLRPGDYVTTLGFYEVNDGGGAQYIIEQDEREQAGNGHISSAGLFPISNNLAAQLINVHTVNYKIFGAKGDGKNDDGPAIKTAHKFANMHQLPVVNLTGHYQIGNTRDIPIETNVNLGQSVLYIDEKYNTNQPVFHIRSRYEAIEIPASGSVGKAVIKQLKPGIQIISELSEFENHLIHLHDEEDRIGFRAGNYSKRGRAREELVYVSQQGRILGDVAWVFNSTVKITAYPAEHSYLVVEGGTFLLSGDSPDYDGSAYTHNGFLVTRSRTRIRRQWVGIETNKSDSSMTPRSGFYYFTTAYDVQMEDIRLNPREKNRPGEDRDVPHGTYGIGGNRVLEFSMSDVVAEGTNIHWGVFGTNMMKNVSLTRCRINRFDVHFHLWNLSIRDCEIGQKGLTLTGGGRLTVSDTVVSHQRFISFRQDYGAKWEGDIFISRCRLRPPFDYEAYILNFKASNFDYGYPIGIARSIEVQDFVIDYSTSPGNDRHCWLLNLSDFSTIETGDRLFFPGYVRFLNVTVKGRTKGVRIASLVDGRGYQVAENGNYDGDIFQANSHWIFDNVDFQSVVPGQKPEDQCHLISSSSGTGQKEYEDDSPHLSLTVRNCKGFSASLTGMRIQFRAEHNIIHQLLLQNNSPLEGEASFESCRFIPVPFQDSSQVIGLEAELGTNLLNCVIHLPLLERDPRLADLALIDFMEFNKRLSHNHINSRLSHKLIQFLTSQQIEISPEFSDKLRLWTDH